MMWVYYYFRCPVLVLLPGLKGKELIDLWQALLCLTEWGVESRQF